MNLIKYQYMYCVSLQNIYQAKAESNYLAMEHHVKSILKRIGIYLESISGVYIKIFWKSLQNIEKYALFVPSFMVAITIILLHKILMDKP
jgi:amyloid beta precursor protein binding protein 1